jgi:hypothetical protein
VKLNGGHLPGLFTEVRNLPTTGVLTRRYSIGLEQKAKEPINEKERKSA